MRLAAVRKRIAAACDAAGRAAEEVERGGALAGQVPGLAGELDAEPGLVLSGVMAIAPLGMEPAAAFARLRHSAALVREVRPAATVISACMSGDLEAAIEAGATHVRIGTALLGDRGALSGNVPREEPERSGERTGTGWED